jgi:hypothetical protein
MSCKCVDCGCRKSQFLSSGGSTKPTKKTTRKTKPQKGKGFLSSSIVNMIGRSGLLKQYDPKFAKWVKSDPERIEQLYEEFKKTQKGGSISGAIATLALFVGYLWTIFSGARQNRAEMYGYDDLDKNFPTDIPDLIPAYDSD